MAYSEALAERVRDALLGREDFTERKMFGGVGFMVNGNMAVGVMEDELIVRLSVAEAEQALREPGVRDFDFTGRKMNGWVYVGPDAFSDEDDFAEWVDAGADYASTLPAK